MNRNHFLVTMAALGAVAAGCGGPLDTADEEASGTSAEALRSNQTRTVAPSATSRTSNVQKIGSAPPLVTQFPILSSYDVYLETEYANLTGVHTQTTVFYAPGGITWQTTSFTFATTVKATGSEVQAAAVGKTWQTYASMPVAGTAIQNYGLSGTWTVAVFLDSATKPMTSQSFTLN
jgi:hypothetical protein